MDADQAIAALTKAGALMSRQQVLTRPCPVPAVQGLYVWYFINLPAAPLVEIPGVGQLGYVGIAPGRPGSRATLRSRIRQHLGGNASTSTLRLTLGCLLGFTLVPTGRTRRLTWGPAGEKALCDWLDQNARVAWVPRPNPWLLEPGVVAALKPPLNLQHNGGHAFCPTLLEYRRRARVAVG